MRLGFGIKRGSAPRNLASYSTPSPVWNRLVPIKTQKSMLTKVRKITVNWSSMGGTLFQTKTVKNLRIATSMTVKEKYDEVAISPNLYVTIKNGWS